MKRKYKLILYITLGVFIVLIILNFAIPKKQITYLKAIEQVYKQDINATALSVFERSNLTSHDGQIYCSAVGSKKNDFSSDNQEGVQLWALKHLFLSLKDLDVISKETPDIINQKDSEYYFIYSNYEYNSSVKNNKIQYLYLFVDKENFHIYIPENYIEYDKLEFVSEFLEYKPNEITKNLIEDIFEIQSDNLNNVIYGTD